MAEIICCGRVVSEKKGKRVCLNCGTEFSVTKRAQKRTFPKHSAKSYYTLGDQVYLLGWLLMISAIAAFGFGAANIWNNGLSAFRLDGFTLILVVGLLGFTLTGGLKKRRKA